MLVCTLGRAYRIRSRSLRHGVAQHHTTAQIEMALRAAISNFQNRMGEPELSVQRAACANDLPPPGVRRLAFFTKLAAALPVEHSFRA